MYNSYLLLHNSVLRFVRCLFIASVLLTMLGYIPIVFQINFDRDLRSIFVIIFSIPALSLVFGIYLYEGRTADQNLKRRFYSGAIITLLFLLVPPVFLITRYHFPDNALPWISRLTATIAFSFTSVLLYSAFGKGFAIKVNAFTYFLTFQKFIMWDSWSNQYKLSNDVHKDSIYPKRETLYVNKANLSIFQDTLTCHVSDSTRAASLLAETTLAKKASIIDIGGGDGRFTHGLLSCLQANGYVINELKVYDPINWKDDYVEHLKDVLPSEKISFHVKSFEHMNEDSQYDLVIASHSLYATWDSSRANDSVLESENRLFALAKPNGFLLVTLASSRSLSYQFKNQALRALFGSEIKDTTAETLQRSFIGKVIKQDTVDNLININNLIEDYERGGSNLNSWLSYFLRFDVKQLSQSDQSSLVEFFLQFSRSLDTFSESEIEKWMEHKGLVIGRHCKVLCHKTRIFILKVKG